MQMQPNHTKFVYVVLIFFLDTEIIWKCNQNHTIFTIYIICIHIIVLKYKKIIWNTTNSCKFHVISSDIIGYKKMIWTATISGKYLVVLLLLFLFIFVFVFFTLFIDILWSFKADVYPAKFWIFPCARRFLADRKKCSTIEVSAAYTHTKMKICKKTGFRLRVVFSNTISQI